MKKKEQLCCLCNLGLHFVACFMIVLQLYKAAFCSYCKMQLALPKSVFRVMNRSLYISFGSLYFISSGGGSLHIVYTPRTAAKFPAFHLRSL